MLEFILRLAARLPLRWLHAAGAVAGRATRRLSPRFAQRLSENLRQSGLAPSDPAGRMRMERRVAAEIGKGVFELIAIWFRPAADARRLMVESRNWDIVDEQRARGRGILFVTPHMGCFEVSGLFAAMQMPFTVLYRPPKLKWLAPLMEAGRTGAGGRIAPTSLAGVRRLLKALKAGEAVGVLPDHVPGFGEGVWAPFFGRPAYTMTLVGRLQKATDCAVILAYSRRLPGGRGYVLEVELLDQDLSGQDGPERLNHAVEGLIRHCPEQYLWSYNRYKVPKGVAPPGQENPPVE